MILTSVPQFSRILFQLVNGIFYYVCVICKTYDNISQKHEHILKIQAFEKTTTCTI